MQILLLSPVAVKELNVFYFITSTCDTRINSSKKGGIRTKARVLIEISSQACNDFSRILFRITNLNVTVLCIILRALSLLSNTARVLKANAFDRFGSSAV